MDALTDSADENFVERVPNMQPVLITAKMNLMVWLRDVARSSGACAWFVFIPDPQDDAGSSCILSLFTMAES